MPNRRQFLGSTSLAAAWWTSQARGASQARNKPPRIDTHLHCFAGNSKQFPYHAHAPYRPQLAATPEQLLHCMDGAGVDYAVVVHPEPYQDDHRYLEHCLDVGGGRLKGTVLLFADQEDSLQKLPRLARREDIVAMRVHAYAPERLPPFGTGQLRKLWGLATEHGLAVQLHFEPRYAEAFEPLIRDFPKTTVLIDHLGRPFQGTPQEHARVVRWARFPHTVMKLSSIPTNRSYPHRDVRPVVKELVNAYGADRMMYGGGFGAEATPASYRAAFERARGFLAELSTEEQRQVLGGTAARLFGFG